MANLSKIKRQRMLDFLATVKQEHTDDDSIRALSEIENHILEKKYGLVWEEHTEHVDELLTENIPIFTEDTDRKITAIADSPYNFILEGDNLQSLYLLLKTHKGKIDLIYIDPPYNRGQNDFIYDDDYIDKTDSFRHSKWLSFMRVRLELARQLLSKDGVIFISIDDNEDATLKLLCDELFGEDCFVAYISWQRTYSMRNDVKGIAGEVEYILVYSKNPLWQPNKLERTQRMNSKYKNPDNDPRGSWRNIVASAPNAITHQGMVYAIQNPITGKMAYPPQGRCWSLGQDQMLQAMNQWCEYELKALNDDEDRARVCGVSANDVRKDVLGIVLKNGIDQSREVALQKYEGVIPEFFFSRKGHGALSRKAYMGEVSGRPVTNFWPFTETGHTDEASRLLKTMFDGVAVFDTPKPPRLIERILQIATSQRSVVLDFFAGSGTTGQAVIELNKKDGGQRKFILCTDNQNGICENVTYPRVYKVIHGYSYTGKKEDILFERKLTLKDLQKADTLMERVETTVESNREKYKRVKPVLKDGVLRVIGEQDTSEGVQGIPANVKYFKCDWTPRKPEDYLLSNALCLHIREMIELQHGIEVDGIHNVLILNKTDFNNTVMNPDVRGNIKNLWVNQNIIFNVAEMEQLRAVGFKYIPREFFGQELKEAAE